MDKKSLPRQQLRSITEIVAALGLITLLGGGVLYCATQRYIWVFISGVVLFLAGMAIMTRLTTNRPRRRRRKRKAGKTV